MEQSRKVDVRDLMKEVDWHMQRCQDSMRRTVDAWLAKNGIAETEPSRASTLSAEGKERERNFFAPRAVPPSSDCNFLHPEAFVQPGMHLVQDGFGLPGEVCEIPCKDDGKALTSSSSLARASRKSRTSLVLDLVESEQERSWLERVTGSRAYEVYSAILILVNSLYIGWQTQFLASRAMNSAIQGQALERALPAELLACQTVFCALFAADLIMRWAAGGLLEFWKSVDLAWNVLDLVVVTISVMDVMTELIALAESTTTDDSILKNFSVLKVLRVVRIVRVAKIIRTMKFFRELRMMVFSIIGSMKSLCWVFLVLGLVFYMFGIAFTSAVTDHFKSSEMWNDPSYADLRQNFGTLDRAVLSLYMAMSGGNDWGAYYDSIASLPFIYSFLYLVFITFSVFAVVNIVTGVFVDSAMQANLVDKDILVHEELEEKKEYLEEVRLIFHALDSDSSGTITLSELENGLQHEKLEAYFRALKLDVSDAAMLFKLLDKSNSQAISIEDFVDGCYKLQGEATAMDTKMTFLEVQAIKDRFALMQQTLTDLQTSIHRSQQ
eukprot:TRINITY_DN26689_c0_g1_i1.p1 TRINITY_DN26689_c0_g1~~TRINITY_DN26689_c0_g1_i1.p1  ORF type:complete len:612 (-),score=114.48 TRINITY_DN26689_c0_g1_i1:380-2035(-)